jgi:pimeloyl-ACP methyl ester carboxylesterase
MLIDLDFADLEGLVGRLTDAHTPTAIIWAEKDPTAPPSVAQRLHTELPDSTLEMIEDCGHFLTEDRPEEVTRALLAALNE